MDIFHPSHPRHALKLSPAGEPFECNLCKEVGFGPRYACKVNPNCNFSLHEECVPLHGSPPPVTHRLFPGCTFHFHKESINRVCDACGRDVRGVSYRCGHRNSKTAHDVHPCCLKLPDYIPMEGRVHLTLSSKVSRKCRRCRRPEAAKKVKGWSYVSGRGEYCYHVACVKEMILDDYQAGHFNSKNYRLALSNINNNNNNNNYSNALSRTSNGGFMSGKKTKMVLKIATVVLKLVISAIFGNPAAGVGVLIEALYK